MLWAPDAIYSSSVEPLGGWGERGGCIRLWIWQAATFPNSGGCCWRKRADESAGPGPNESCHWQFAAWMWALIGKTVNRCFVGEENRRRESDGDLGRMAGGPIWSDTGRRSCSRDCKHDWNCPFGAAVLVNSMLMVQFIRLNINVPRASARRWVKDVKMPSIRWGAPDLTAPVKHRLEEFMSGVWLVYVRPTCWRTFKTATELRAHTLALVSLACSCLLSLVKQRQGGQREMGWGGVDLACHCNISILCCLWVFSNASLFVFVFFLNVNYLQISSILTFQLVIRWYCENLSKTVGKIWQCCF